MVIGEGGESRQLLSLKEHRRFFGDTYDYTNTVYSCVKDKVEVNCRQHGIFLATPTDHLMGHGCPKCAHFYSKPRKKIVQYLESLGYSEKKDFLINDRKTLYNPRTNRYLELDILFVREGKAIEVDGVYFRSSSATTISRDRVKDQLCLEQGIELLRITDKQIIKDWYGVEKSVCSLLHL